MNRVIVVSSLLLIGIPASAQSNFPKLELFAGYAFQTVLTPDQFHPIPTLPNLGQQWFRAKRWKEHSQGLSFGYSRNFTEHFGVTSTFGWQRAADMTVACIMPLDMAVAPRQPCLEERDSGLSQILVGPRFTSRKGRITHFTHTLIGTYLPTGRNSASVAMSGDRLLAMSFGGGTDVALNDRFSVRTFQVDYVSGRDFLFGRPHVRLQSGIVLTFGRR